jgi:hypothetical protein
VKRFNRRTLVMSLSILEKVALGLLFMFLILNEIYTLIYHCVVGPVSLRLGMGISFALMLLFGFLRRKIEKEFPEAASRKKQKNRKKQAQSRRREDPSRLRAKKVNKNKPDGAPSGFLLREDCVSRASKSIPPKNS